MPGTPATTPRHAIPRIASTDTDDVPRDLNAAVDRIDITAPVFISGLAAARPAAGIADRYHYATDTGELTRDTGSAWVGPLNPRSIATVSALPGAPYDGQIIDYLADATLGIVWRFRYRAASASPYKWEAIGSQAPLTAENTATASTTSATYIDIDLQTPSLTIPLAGDYLIGFGATIWNATVNAGGYVAAKLGAAAAADADAVNHTSATASADSSAWRSIRRNALAAAATIKLQYRSAGGGTPNFSRRNLEVRPLRVG